MTSCWQVADNLWHHFSVYCIELSTISKTSLSLPSSADFLPHFWHRCGTDVAISWRKKMSSKVKPKNRVMCLKNLGGVWGGSLPNLGGHGGKAWKLAERSTQQDNSSEPTDPLNNVPLISLRQMRQKNLRKDFGILWLLGELATRPIEMIKVCNKKALSRRGERLQHSGA